MNGADIFIHIFLAGESDAMMFAMDAESGLDSDTSGTSAQLAPHITPSGKGLSILKYM